MYEAGDEKAIIPLFELVFKRPYTLEQWRWRFAENPYGNFKIALMWDGNVLAGHYAVSPVDMLIDGNRVKTALSLTTMTHPNYGGKGIFKQLASYLYNELENNQGFEFIWGFPNNNSHYGFVKNLDWQNISAVHTMAASPDMFVSVSKSVIHKASYFTDAMSGLLYESATLNRVSVIRSKDYLRWRICEKPSTEYNIYYKGTETEPEAVVVTKVYNVDDGFYDLNLVDWACIDLKLLPSLIASIVEESTSVNRRMRRLTLWSNMWDIHTYGALEKMGFVPVSPITYLAGRATTKRSQTALAMSNWYLAFMDSDVY